MQKLYALFLLLAMALVACTPAAQQQSQSVQNQPAENVASQNMGNSRPRFLISYANW